ncbi:MAG TPA: hypothetical protein VEU47_19080 [Candidatus Cybelea sp.]|nr:hypothetical protein [Candidatus Cybelea sp.]
MAQKSPPVPTAPIQITGNAEAILSKEDIQRAKAEARKQIEAERHKAAMAEVIEAERRRLKMEEGFTTGIATNDEMVDITINLDRSAATPGIVINGFTYMHAGTYTVPRHVANQLREAMFRVEMAEKMRKGEVDYSMYHQRRDTKITLRKDGSVAGIANAPQGAA